MDVLKIAAFSDGNSGGNPAGVVIADNLPNDQEMQRMAALALFGYGYNDLDPRIPPAHIHAGADHLLLCLKTRKALASMKYDLNAGRDLMRQENLVTITLAYAETSQLFHTRNPFASGGVYEDPATGSSIRVSGTARIMN